MENNYFVRELATNHNLWKQYIDPSNQGGNDFETMSVNEKMEMIVDLWPEDILSDDTEALEILKKIRNARKQAASLLGKKGGSVKSERKSKSSAANGRLGGRPAKTQPTQVAADGDNMAQK